MEESAIFTVLVKLLLMKVYIIEPSPIFTKVPSPTFQESDIVTKPLEVPQPSRHREVGASVLSSAEASRRGSNPLG